MNYRNSFIFILTIVGLLIFSSCQKNKTPIPIPATDENGKATPIFKRLSANESGINFTNQIDENETYNHILVDVVFNGGGVAVVGTGDDVGTLILIS